MPYRGVLIFAVRYFRQVVLHALRGIAAVGQGNKVCFARCHANLIVSRPKIFLQADPASQVLTRLELHGQMRLRKVQLDFFAANFL